MSLFLSKQEEKPLTTCHKCKDQPCIKTGKICDEVEAMLPKITTGRHKKEIIVSSDYAESLGIQRAFKLKYGKKYDIFKENNY